MNSKAIVLVREAEILLPASLIAGRVEVMYALLLCHGVPLLVALLVLVHVEALGNEIHANVHTGDGDEYAISTAVCKRWSTKLFGHSMRLIYGIRLTLRPIIFSVNVRVDDTSKLNHHALSNVSTGLNQRSEEKNSLIQGGRHCSSSDRVGVAARPSNVHGVGCEDY